MNKLTLTIMCGIFFLGILPTQGEAQVIGKDSKVTFNYTLTVDGQVIESSEGKEPLEYTHGQGMIIPGLEQALEGLKVNDTKKVIVAPEDAYGVRDDSRVMELSKANLPQEIAPQPGMVLQLQTQGGQPMMGIIVDVKEDTVTIDFNHPLAGKELTFNVTIVSIN